MQSFTVNKIAVPTKRGTDLLKISPKPSIAISNVAWSDDVQCELALGKLETA